MTGGRGRAILALAALAVLAGALHRLGAGSLAPPPASPAAWTDWIEATGPPHAALAVVRLLALGAVGYLTVLVAVTGIAPRRGEPVLCRVPWGRPILAAVGLSAPLLVATPAFGAGSDTPPPTAGARLTCTEGCPSDAPSTTIGRPNDEPVPLAPPSPPAHAQPGLSPDPDPADAPTPPDPQPAASPSPSPASEPGPGPDASPERDAAAEPLGDAATWTIAPGDHLWSVAQETLHDAGAPADVDAVGDYLHRLVEENRGVLIDPTNADLVLPGQVFVLPPIGP